MFLTGCAKYAEPDVSSLMTDILVGQSVEEPTYAESSDLGIIFDLNLEDIEEYSVVYSGKGGSADIVAIFKLYDVEKADEYLQMLSKYKDDRYNDFVGYAPFEAEKIENGRVLTYGRYAVLMILSDIDTALDTVEAAFKL